MSDEVRADAEDRIRALGGRIEAIVSKPPLLTTSLKLRSELS